MGGSVFLPTPCLQSVWLAGGRVGKRGIYTGSLKLPGLAARVDPFIELAAEKTCKNTPQRWEKRRLPPTPPSLRRKILPGLSLVPSEPCFSLGRLSPKNRCFRHFETRVLESLLVW